jgi:hypothetical protein
MRSVVDRNVVTRRIPVLTESISKNTAMANYWNGTINKNKGNRTIREKVTVVVVGVVVVVVVVVVE